MIEFVGMLVIFYGLGLFYFRRGFGHEIIKYINRHAENSASNGNAELWCFGLLGDDIT